VDAFMVAERNWRVGGTPVARRVAALALMVTAAVLCVLSGGAGGQEKLEQTTVDIVATRDTQIGAQLAIADALGYFKDEGLQVTPKWVQSGDDVVQLLGSAAVPVGCASTFGATLLAAQKMPIRAIAGLADIGGTQGFVLAPGVKLSNPKELEGKKLAYTNGNPQVLILAKLAKVYGFDFSKVTLVNMQPSEGVVAATKGDVVGLLSFQPNLYRLVALGGTMYATGRDSWVTGSHQALGAEDRLLYLNSMIMAQDSWIKDKPNTLKALIRAFNRATQLIATDRAKALEQVQKQVRIDADALAAIMNINEYSPALTVPMGLSISYLSDWALSIKRIPGAVTPEDIIDPRILTSMDPSLVTWKARR
jgi:ABC-type nitrate/sulfonate/bicarbonate transport system substrate-binding protein